MFQQETKNRKHPILSITHDRARFGTDREDKNLQNLIGEKIIDLRNI